MNHKLRHCVINKWIHLCNEDTVTYEQPGIILKPKPINFRGKTS